MNQERTVRLLNVTALLVLLIVAGSAAAVVVNPPDREPETEFYILAGNESGEPVAGGYSGQIMANGSIYVGIGHELDTPQQYTLVVQLQQVDTDGDTTEVTQTRNVDSISIQVSPGSRTVRPVDLSLGSDQQYSRIAFLLYRGSVPPDPSIGTAHRSTYVWLEPQTGPGQ